MRRQRILRRRDDALVDRCSHVHECAEQSAIDHARARHEQRLQTAELPVPERLASVPVKKKPVKARRK